MPTAELKKVDHEGGQIDDAPVAAPEEEAASSVAGPVLEAPRNDEGGAVAQVLDALAEEARNGPPQDVEMAEIPTGVDGMIKEEGTGASATQGNVAVDPSVAGVAAPNLPDIQIPPLNGPGVELTPAVYPPDPTEGTAEVSTEPKYKRRICRFPGCNSCVKSQGHCQKHGAKPKRCRATGCKNQAQGSHKGYCKKHWREFEAPEEERRTPKKKKVIEESIACEPYGHSVYDEILPLSFAWKTSTKPLKVKRGPSLGGTTLNIPRTEQEPLSLSDSEEHLVYKETDLIPIAQHFADNAHLEPGWHRKNERLARGIRPPKSISCQLEPWEKQLAILEMALITGTFSDPGKTGTSRHHRNLAHAWGREKGFHKIMVEQVCLRRGDLERKKRNDSGVKLTSEMKEQKKKNRVLYKIYREEDRIKFQEHLKREQEEKGVTAEEEVMNMAAEAAVEAAVEAAAYATVAGAEEFVPEDSLARPPQMEPDPIEEIVDASPEQQQVQPPVEI